MRETRIARAGLQVNEGSGDLAPVAKLEGALAQAASGDDADGIGGAAIDLDEGDEPLAVFAVGIVDAQQFEAAHGQANAQHLSGAQMSVGHFGVAQQFVEILQIDFSSSSSSRRVKNPTDGSSDESPPRR